MTRQAGAAWLLFAAALALRLGWVGYAWQRDGAQLTYDDERLHWELATNLVRRGELVSDDGRRAARMPAYPLFLAVFAGAGTSGVLWARVAQAAGGAAGVVVVYHLARRATGRRGGMIAGALACADPFAVFFCNLLLTEGVFTCIAVGFVACAYAATTRARAGGMVRAAPWVGVAGLGAAAVMTRPSALGWVVLSWLVLWLMAVGRRRATLGVFACAATLALCFLPWGLRNRAVLGSYAWLSTNGGVTLYDAQGPQADGSSNQAFVREMPELAGLNEAEQDRRLQQMAIEQMRADPGRVLRLAGVKLLRTWSPVPNVAEHRGGATGLVSAVYTTVTLVLAVIGGWRTLRARPAGRPLAGSLPAAREEERQRRTILAYHALIWLPVAYFTLAHCVYVGSVRYRVPLMPLLALAAAECLRERDANSLDPQRPRRQ